MSWLSMQSVAQISVEHIFNALPAGFVIALFAWGFLRAFRRQNSGTRFAVWFLALLTIAALPFLSGFGNGRTLPLQSSLRPAISIPEHWALFVFIAWALGASSALLRLAAGFWRLHRLRQSCTEINLTDLNPTLKSTLLKNTLLQNTSLRNSSLRNTLATIRSSNSAGLFKTSKPIAIAMSEDLRVPAAIGFWNRTIVLPAWAMRELSPEDLNVILLHEFAHLRRGDDWTNLIQKIVRALFFFHPAVWWIENRLSVEREMACDDAVLAETANPHAYATCLVSLLEKSLAHRGLTMAQAAVHRAHEASLRLAEILNKNRPAATKVWSPALGVAGVFSVLCLVAAPQAPRLVAFDHPSNVLAQQTTAALTNGGPGVLARQASAQMVRAMASAKTVPAPSLAVVHQGDPQDAHRSAARPHNFTERQRAPAVVAVRLNADAPRLVEARATEDQEPVPQIQTQFQTLIFIETTPFTPDSPSMGQAVMVRVWRITWITTPHANAERVPVANSI
jgi:Zn-dependent protease with chaperone function